MPTPSAYLQSGEYATYGVASGTTSAQVILASSVVDTYLLRPQGLICQIDANGNPYAMAAASPNATYTSTGSLAPGMNVLATLAPAVLTPDVLGEVLTIDSGAVVESCVVSAYNSNSQVTLANVQFSHSTGVSVGTGLCITDERQMGIRQDATIILSEVPLASVLSILGKVKCGWPQGPVLPAPYPYGPTYPSQPPGSVPYGVALPLWQAIPSTYASISPRTGELWVAGDLLPVRYSAFRILYVAGWPEAQIPTAVKMATAQIINTGFFLAGVPSSLKAANSGGPSLTRFRDTVLDANVRQLLDPFKARLRWGIQG